MKKILHLLLLITISTVLIWGCKPETDRVIGIKIYEYNGDYGELVDQWKDVGINTAFVSVGMASDMAFRSVLKRHNIPVFIICPVFYNPTALKADSSLYAITQKGKIAKDDWVEFVCPSRKGYRKHLADSIAGLVKSLDPEGISIDFIRQFVFWEMIYADRTGESIDKACFCDSCLKEFSSEMALTFPDTCKTPRQKAEFLLQNHEESWNDFRTDLIAGTVKQIVDAVEKEKPGILICVHAVPWRSKDFDGAQINVAAQDLYKITPFADYISPMCYSQMLDREPSWISSVVSDMDLSAPGMVLPSIQVYEYYINKQFDVEEFRECLVNALKAPSNGVVFWSWPLFGKDPGRLEVVREVLKNDRARV